MRILIIRTSALGDIVHSLPVLTTLRRELPDAKIGWLVESAMAPLLEEHPDLDQLLVVRLRTWRRRPFSIQTVREVRTFLGELRRFSPDVVLDLMGNHKAGVLGALSLADRRIGATRRDRRERSSSLWISEPTPLQGTHVVDRALSLLEGLSISSSKADFDGDKLFPAAQRPHGLPDRYFLIHPGAAWANKRYPAALWGEVGRQLEIATGLQGVVVGAPADEPLVRETGHASDGALLELLTPDLPSLAATMRGSDLVLGADTGPVHLAHALGRPVLCLMGPTDPDTHGPYSEPQATLARQLPCSGCYRRFEEPKACLTTIPPGAVTERAEQLLNL